MVSVVCANQSRTITQVYGFYDEIAAKYFDGAECWKVVCQTFDLLPLAAVVSGPLI